MLIIRLISGCGPRVLRIGSQLLVNTSPFATPIYLGLILLILLELIDPLLLIQGLLHLCQSGLRFGHWLGCALSDLTFISSVFHAVYGGRIGISSRPATFGRFLLLCVYGLFPVALRGLFDSVDSVCSCLDGGYSRRTWMQSAPSLILVIVKRSDDALLLGAGSLRARKVEIELAQSFLFADHAASLVLRCIL